MIVNALSSSPAVLWIADQPGQGAKVMFGRLAQALVSPPELLSRMTPSVQSALRTATGSGVSRVCKRPATSTDEFEGVFQSQGGHKSKSLILGR
jgi:hypothetical protein